MTRRMSLIVLIAGLSLAALGQTPVDQTKPARPDGRVSIENVAGSVTVTGWDRSEIQVKGTLGKNTEPLVFENQDGTTRIEVRPKKMARGQGEGLLVVQVPRRSRVEVDTVSADILVRDLRGAVDLHSVSGRVDASAVTGDLGMESVSGRIQAEASSRALKCASVSGDIRLTGQQPSRVEMKSVSGGALYGGGLGKGGEIRCETVSGSVEIRLPTNVSADFQASTFSGEITADPPEAMNLKKDGPVGRTARFHLGGGDGSVTVETFSGSIRFVRK